MEKQKFNFVILAVVLAMVGILFISAGNPNKEKQIVDFLESFRSAYKASDFESWSHHWRQSEDALFTYVQMENHNVMHGWNEISKNFKEIFNERKTNNHDSKEQKNFSNKSIIIDGNMAWVDAEETMGNKVQRHTLILQKINGEWKVINTNLINTSSYREGKFVVDANQVPEKTHVHIDNFPQAVLPMFVGWGGMAVERHNVPAGTDFTPLLQGLENNHCQVPHWGYLVKGSLEMEYEDREKDIINAGEVFYMKPGHTARVVEDLTLVSFGPENGMINLKAHFEKKVAQMTK